MATPRTLVFGDDGSPPADTAWLWINNHRWPDWRVIAVTARMPELGPPVDPELAHPHRWEPTSPRVPFAESGIAEVEHLTCVMDPRLALGDFEPTPDLVVVGPTGRGVLKALHLGSTADWLLEDPSAPLVIARSARRAEHILVCADGSDHAQRAAEVLAGLPLVTNAAVMVLGIDDGRADPASGIARAVPVLEEAGAKVSTVEVSGKPTRTILDQIDEHDAGLVALGTRGHTSIRRLFVGSTASGVARSAPCSVLTVTASGAG
ncbi:MAG TPA: universal stress protein [Acidimicrobiales bacterium]